MFYDKYADLCKQRNLKPLQAAVEMGLSKGSVSRWKKLWEEGKEVTPKMDYIRKMADFFNVSVDYLLDATDDPTDYDDGDLLASIPLTYVEAAKGDMKQARAMQLAAERDAQMEAQKKAGLLNRFSQRDASLIFALWGDAENIDDQDIADIRKFADYVKERKNRK